MPTPETEEPDELDDEEEPDDEAEETEPQQLSNLRP